MVAIAARRGCMLSFPSMVCVGTAQNHIAMLVGLALNCGCGPTCGVHIECRLARWALHPLLRIKVRGPWKRQGQHGVAWRRRRLPQGVAWRCSAARARTGEQLRDRTCGAGPSTLVANAHSQVAQIHVRLQHVHTCSARRRRRPGGGGASQAARAPWGPGRRRRHALTVHGWRAGAGGSQGGARASERAVTGRF